MERKIDYSELSILFLKIIDVKKDVDLALKEIDADISVIKDRYSPRSKFNRWRDSQDGKYWKEQKWKKQGCRCAECDNEVSLLGSHIDHIKPLSKYPELALETNNLQITCLNCNASKGNRE